MSLLDTVEPAGWKRTRISNGEVEYFADRDWKHEGLFEWEPCYPRETVEFLLSQCRKEARKEALLEAVEVCDEKIASYEYLANGETMDDQKTRVLNRRLGA